MSTYFERVVALYRKEFWDLKNRPLFFVVSWSIIFIVCITLNYFVLGAIIIPSTIVGLSLSPLLGAITTDYTEEF